MKTKYLINSMFEMKHNLIQDENGPARIPSSHGFQRAFPFHTSTPFLISSELYIPLDESQGDLVCQRSDLGRVS